MVEVSNSLIIGGIENNTVLIPFHGTPPLNPYATFSHARKPLPIVVTDQAPLPSLSESVITVEETIHGSIPSKSATTVVCRSGTQVDDQSSGGFETWWESFHVTPRSFAFGNLLSTQTAPIEVYSAFRRLDQDWTDLINNGGAGITILGQPALPFTFVPQSDGGLSLSLQVSTSGQPVVDDTIDWVFGTVPQTVKTPITLKRVVLFSIQPELPFTERLQWLTEVLQHVDGTEQRISARKNPRQIFDWDFIMEDGPERAFFSNILFDWQARIFGLPIWYELTRISSAVTAGDTTITVQSTAYADYRVGGLFLIFTDKGTFDVLELDSTPGPTSLVSTSGTNNSYPTGTFVMPLRTGTAKSQITGSRFVSADAKMKILFTVSDNDVDLADLSAWPSYNSKLLLDGCNSVRGQTAETFERDIIEFDNPIGLRTQDSPWAQGKRITQLALLAKGKKGLWDVRQMLHAIRGKQISFYAATFSNDFTSDGAIAAGTLVDVVNIGYTQFAQARQPRNVVRIEYNNGDPDDIREILSSTEVDATRETLTLDSAVAAHTQAQVKKISLVEKVRFDSDNIAIRHEIGDTTTRTTSPIKTVFD